MNRALIPVVAVVVLAFSAIFGRDLVDYRMSELDFLLEQAAEIEESADTLSIVGKYELIRRRIEMGEYAISNYTLEARTVAASAASIYSGLELQESTTLIPVQVFLQPLHWIMGKSTFDRRNVEQQADAIEIAYFWERNRNYERAIDGYKTALSDQKHAKPAVAATILLHQGFCHSMLNQYPQARACFREAIERYPETDAGILAWKLLDFLDSLEARRELADADVMDAFQAGRQAYFLVDYRGSIAHLSRYLDEVGEEGYVAEARYFKARSHEELGEVDQAVREYQTLLQDPDDRRWAVLAGRRLYMLGVYYGAGEQIDEESKARVAALEDTDFLDAVGRFAEPGSMGYAESEPRAAESAVGQQPPQPVPQVPPPSSAWLTDTPPQTLSLSEPQEGIRPTASAEEPAALGGLDIENRELGLSVYLNGVLLGRLEQGPFEGIEPGEYRLELRGDGQEQPERFGTALVSVQAGGNTAVFVEPLPYGGIEYRIPEGTAAVLEGADVRIPMSGEGVLRFLPAGEYSIALSCPGHPSALQAISVKPDETVGFFPAGPLSVVPADTGRQPANQGAATLPPPESSAGEQRGMVIARIDRLKAERSALTEEIEQMRNRRRTVTRGRWVSYGIGLAALGGMGASLYFGYQSYEDYQAAIYTDDAIALRNRTQLFRGIAITSGVIGALSITGGTILLAVNPNLERLQHRLDHLDAEIERLERDSK